MGKKLTIYMIDGTPEGPKTFDIGNWSGKAISSPRAGAKNLLHREEFERPGVYILRSISESSDYDDAIYIGEAENLGARLKQHLSSERDFESFICFYSKDDLLTKSHIRYLESRLVSLAKDAKNSEVTNDKHPTLSKLSEADVSDMEAFIAQVSLILPVAGVRALISTVATDSSRAQSKTNTKYSLRSNRLTANMVEVSDGYLVLKGSQFALTESDSISAGWKRLRSKLVDEGLVEVTGDLGILTDDVLFNSPSAASSTLLGSQSPGPIRWIDDCGRTFKDNQEFGISGSE